MIGRAPQRIGVEVGVALRRAGARVPQQLTDDRQPKAGPRTETRMGVSQVVNA